MITWLLAARVLVHTRYTCAQCCLNAGGIHFNTKEQSRSALPFTHATRYTNTLHCLLGAGWPGPTLAPALSNTRCRSPSALGAGGSCVFVRVSGEAVVYCAHKRMCACSSKRRGGQSDDCSGWVHHQGHGPQRTVSIAVTLHRHKQATWSLTARQTTPRAYSCRSLTVALSIVFLFLQSPSLIMHYQRNNCN